ncbi:MAG: acyl-CoA dehydratase activase-related protein, partial [Eggerthellaceae bacterium]|nr:acyl-CoA dehydratase activase-related protein [Eggerthellaceae bacterium]
GVRSQDMSTLAMGANRIYPIASRCAVFAQTDVRPLLYSGAKKADIAASVLEAVVHQTITGLACGRQIKGNVVFLGGPLEHIPDLVFRFRRALGLTHKTGIKPHDAHLFTAMGTALLGPKLLEREGLAESFSLAGLERMLDTAPSIGTGLQTLPPLFSSVLERQEFMERHHTAKTPRRRLTDCVGPLYLGIDAGSTTVKLAVVDGGLNLVYSDYQPTKGDTLQTASLMLGDLYRQLPHEHTGRPLAHIGNAAVTGYGEDLLKAAFCIDLGMVETMAHLQAAQQLYPAVDFILDIGGQDMKALWLRDGIIANAVLNEACSSGCGSFIEGTAYSLRLNRYSFAEAALASSAPVDLGIKCTVFMTSRVRHAQKAGVPYEDIAAGLAYSVVKNALFKIIGMNSINDMGKNVVVQGGAFMSDAVLRAFELVSGVQVVRPDIAHLMGAFGAAITAAAQAGPGISSIVTPDELAALNPAKRVQRCAGCANACLLTVMDFGGKRLFVSGNRCSRALSILTGNSLARVDAPQGAPLPNRQGASARKAPSRGASARGAAFPRFPEKVPDLYELEQKLLARYGRRDLRPQEPDGSNASVFIGIPRVLNLYENIPFWHTLFTQLGFPVVLPPSTVDEGDVSGPDAPAAAKPAMRPTGYAQANGLETVPSESVCYPAKTAHAHVAELLHADVDVVFMPGFERGTRCPVTSCYAQVLAGNIPALASGEAFLLSPTLQAIRPERIARLPEDKAALLEAINAIPRLKEAVSPGALEAAISTALKEQEGFLALLGQAAQSALSWMRRQGKRGIVLAGRPYHVDENMSHGINTLLGELGFAVFSPVALRHMPKEGGFNFPDQGQKTPSVAWKPAKTLSQIARFTSSQPDLDLVCLYSFGCGFDALSLEPARKAVEGAGKVFTAFKIDDIVDLAHIRIRLRTLTETLLGGDAAAARNAGAAGNTKTAGALLAANGPESASRKPGHSGMGDKEPKTARLGALSQDDIDCARSFVTHDVCLVASALAGAAINLLRRDSAITTLVVPHVCFDCLLDSLPDLVAQALGWAPEIVWEDAWHGFKAPAPCEGRPRVGILGNALLCFDAFANRSIADLIEELDCEAVFPPPGALFTDDVRYIDQIRAFAQQGIHDIVYLQAFGCLKGHIQSRGAARELTRLFPELRLTIIDYDYDISELNQENRIRLALAATDPPPQ